MYFPSNKFPKPEFVLTVGAESQLNGLFNGVFMKGNREPRIAMVGRSNVGKSSLINTMIGARLAQTSAEPGKTRSIHFYKWPEAGKIIADLPGYGFAKASHDERERWSRFINAYLLADPHLDRAIVLLDARHGPTELDAQAIQFLSLKRIPVTIVFTKADSLKTQAARSARKKESAVALDALGFGRQSVYWVSAKSGDGIKPLVQALSVKVSTG